MVPVCKQPFLDCPSASATLVSMANWKGKQIADLILFWYLFAAFFSGSGRGESFLTLYHSISPCCVSLPFLVLYVHASQFFSLSTLLALEFTWVTLPFATCKSSWHLTLDRLSYLQSLSSTFLFLFLFPFLHFLFAHTPAYHSHAIDFTGRRFCIPCPFH